MKKLLPKTKNNTQGFTLIELLVVIAIIAILSVIGVTVFSGVQKNARDAKRKGDIDAIATALETAKTTVYSNLTGTNFAGGIVPVDSGNTLANSSTNTYCVYSNAGGTITAGPSAVWASVTCPVGTGTANAISTTAVTLTTNTTNWTVCASLENSAAVYCESSAQ